MFQLTVLRFRFVQDIYHERAWLHSRVDQVGRAVGRPRQDIANSLWSTMRNRLLDRLTLTPLFAFFIPWPWYSRRSGCSALLGRQVVVKCVVETTGAAHSEKLFAYLSEKGYPLEHD